MRKLVSARLLWALAGAVLFVNGIVALRACDLAILPLFDRKLCAAIPGARQ